MVAKESQEHELRPTGVIVKDSGGAGQDDCKVFPHNGICSQPVYPAKAGIRSFNLGVLLSPGRTARIEQLCNCPVQLAGGIHVLDQRE